jgi:hypothetical protein
VYQRDFYPEPFDEGDAVIWILANLVTKSIAESPNDKRHRTDVLESMRLGIAWKIADSVTWFDWLLFISVMQHSAARHHDEDLLLEEMTMTAGGKVAGRYGLDHQTNICAADVSAYVRHLSRRSTRRSGSQKAQVTNIYLTERHGNLPQTKPSALNESAAESM